MNNIKTIKLHTITAFLILFCCLLIFSSPVHAKGLILTADGMKNSTAYSGKTDWPKTKITSTKLVASKKIRINWNKSSQAVGYVLYQKINGKWKLKQKLEGKGMTHTYVGGISKGKQYVFAIEPAVKNEAGKTIYPAKVRSSSVKKVRLNKDTVKIKKGSYKKGSVYGPKLTTGKLSQVKKAVQKFNDDYITSDMTVLEKVIVAQAFMDYKCVYAKSWAKNGANTAWGSLVYKNKKGYHEAQCSGYARGFKALMDSVGVPCQYIHANKKASNPNHQWTVTKLSGKWYVIDPQLNSSSGTIWIMGRKTYQSYFGMRWNNSSKVTAGDFSSEKIGNVIQSSVSVQMALTKMSR